MQHTLLLLLSFALMSHSASAQTIRYVNQNVAGGLENGSTWADAFPELQQALAAAQSGDEIWVVSGTYKPTQGTNRSISFLLKSGVRVYGGFAGTETAAEQRNPLVHETILSGDIGIPGNDTDNSYHVVRGKGLDANTVLDGFTVTRGYSYGQFTPASLDVLGAGMLLEGAPGMVNSRPLIANCRFEYNFGYYGGGLSTTWEDPDIPAQGKNLVNPVLRQCTFSRNRAYLGGGAIYLNSPSGNTDTLTLEQCAITDNYVYTGEGGGIYFNKTAFSNTRITGCLFERDSSFGGLAGAIYYPAAAQTQNTSSLVLEFCAFTRNVSPEGTGLFYNGYLSSSTPGVQFFCRMAHCVFDGNKTTASDGSAYRMITSFGGKITAEITDCIFKENLSGNYTTTISAVASSETDILIERCVFINNHDRDSPEEICLAVHSGSSGASSVTSFVNKVTTRINNCLFANNGGAVAVQSGQKNYVTTNITNCTFYNNNEYVFIKQWDTLYNQPNGYFNDMYIDNCIIWETETDIVKMFYNNLPNDLSMYGYHISHSLLNLTDSTGVPGSLEAFGDGLIFDQYPLFEDTAAGNFRLQVCSPAVGKGNNTATFDAGLLVDLDSMTRIRYGAVDLGAYEQQDSCDIVDADEPNAIFALQLWPNPSVSGMFFLRSPDVSEGWLRLFDMNGREVYQHSMNRAGDYAIDLAFLPPGLYQVRLETADQVFAGKWIKI